jgi:predicted DNA-binding transcriptional regulator AlpA
MHDFIHPQRGLAGDSEYPLTPESPLPSSPGRDRPLSIDEIDEAREARRAARGSPFLTSKQAAYFLGFSDRTLADMRRRGTGPRFVRMGRQVRYHIRDLNAYARPGRSHDRD